MYLFVYRERCKHIYIYIYIHMMYALLVYNIVSTTSAPERHVDDAVDGQRARRTEATPMNYICSHMCFNCLFTLPVSCVMFQKSVNKSTPNFCTPSRDNICSHMCLVSFLTEAPCLACRSRREAARKANDENEKKQHPEIRTIARNENEKKQHPEIRTRYIYIYIYIYIYTQISFDNK